MINKSADDEGNSNWDGAYEKVEENEPKNSNVISSNIVHKVKIEEVGKMRLKPRLVPHSNRDRMKYYVRKDTELTQFEVMRIVL